MMQLKPSSDLAEQPDYWKTMEGISTRLEYFKEQLESGTWNNAVRITASAVGVFDMEIIGPVDSRTCEWCAENTGKVYRSNRGFLPQLPKHIGCRHWWELTYLGERGGGEPPTKPPVTPPSPPPTDYAYLYAQAMVLANIERERRRKKWLALTSKELSK